MRKLFLTSMAIASVVCAAQMEARTVKGVVLDAGTGEAIIGATVMPIGGGEGAATDIDGRFTINVPDNVKTARISSVGYKEKTVTLTSDMRIELASTTTNLEEQVVVAYGTASRESLTGSVTVVGSKEIEDRPVTSVTQALEGNAPGVQVNSTTGGPGSSPSIIIRGVGTITGSTSPLYVVDGVPFGGGIADLNPADIESMTVLKDAASCALYGNRGANGVVLITTKKAKNMGRAEVTLTIREGIYSRGLPEYNRLDSKQWMEMMFNATANQLMYDSPGMYPDRNSAYAFLQQNFIQGYLNNQNIFDMPADQLFDANGRVLGNVLPGYTDLDWWDAVSRSGLRQEYNMNIAAASEKYNMFASVGYLNEKGYLIKTDFERFNGRFNVNFQPVSYFKAGVNLAASYQTSEANSAGSGTAINPFQTQFYAPIFGYYEHDPETGAIVYDEKTGKPKWNLLGRNDNRNVPYETRLNFTEYNGSYIDANAYATAVIPYGFELTFRGTMSRNYTTGKNYQNRVLGDARAIGRLSEAVNWDRQHTFMQQLTWNHTYGNDAHQHNVDVFLGHENTSAFAEDLSVSMTDQNRDGEYFPSNFADIISVPSGSYAEGRSESYLGRARYNYDQKYFGEFSLRRDGADRFSKDNRWGTFWSVGGSWIISKENFMHSLTWVDYAKLRVSYGTVGNYLAAPAMSWESLYASGIGYSNLAVLKRATNGNPDLKWEGQRTLDIGLEGSLFNGRLNFSVGYFDKTSDDMIFQLSTAGSIAYAMAGSGIMTTPYNIGKVSNRGWEISFNGTIMRNENFQWTANIDATFMSNKIKSLPHGNIDYANGIQRLSVGRSMFSWWIPEFVGVDELTGNSLYTFSKDEYMYRYKDSYTQEENEANWNTNVANAIAANALVEIDGKTYTTSQTYATNGWHGKAMPTVYGSFGSNLSWKGINFGFLFTYSLGGKVLDNMYIDLMTVSSRNANYHQDVLKAWNSVPEAYADYTPTMNEMGVPVHPSGCINPDGIPVNNPSLSQENNFTSTRFLTNRSWLVLKNIMLSYDLPQNWVRKLQLQNINLGVSIDNLFTVAARKGMNPSMSYGGSLGGTSDAVYSTTRVVSFQLNVRF